MDRTSINTDIKSDDKEPIDQTVSGVSGSKKRRFSADLTVAASCVAFVACMVGMTYAAVPLYEMFCRVTGFGGTPQIATELPDEVLDHIVTVRFDANTDKDLPWSFEPKVRSVEVKLGEVRQLDYVAASLTDVPTWGTAAFNVTPDAAGAYFNKVTCFCFNQQELAAGESVDMPVVFFVDPEIVNSKNFQFFDTITLSYTFYASEPVDGEPSEADPVTTGSLELDAADTYVTKEGRG